MVKWASSKDSKVTAQEMNDCWAEMWQKLKNIGEPGW